MVEVGMPFIGLKREESGRVVKDRVNEVGEGDSMGQRRFVGGGEAEQMARLPHGTGGRFSAQRDGGSGQKGLAVMTRNGQRWEMSGGVGQMGRKS
jgi:hypothetical protein